jgi:hypothetical protein
MKKMKKMKKDEKLSENGGGEREGERDSDFLK